MRSGSQVEVGPVVPEWRIFLIDLTDFVNLSRYSSGQGLVLSLNKRLKGVTSLLLPLWVNSQNTTLPE